MNNETNPGTVEALNIAASELLEGRSNWGSDGAFKSGVSRMYQAAKDILAAQSQPAATAQEVDNCERCQGNGEIVTDWDRYLHGHEGDKGDEAVAECPDCNGAGHVALTAEPAAKAGDAEPVAWMYVSPNHPDNVRLSQLRQRYWVDDHGWIETPLYAAPPSPQPDMGSGKARTRVAEAVGRVLGIDIHERCPSEDSEGDLGCDSSTCPGALTEDHDTEEHRERIYRMADAAISALSPLASQSVEKTREALKNLTHFADDHGLEQERGGVAIMKAAWDALSTLPHKEEAAPEPVGEQGAAKAVCSIPNCGKPAPADQPFCATHRHEKRPYAHCCNGDPRHCDCAKPDHGEALYATTTEQGRG